MSNGEREKGKRKEMKTNKMIVSAVAAVAVMSSWATDWYVDAVNGNDQWDGSTAAVPTQEQIEAGGTVAGPRRTLHAMMSDDKVVAGHTVWAAEGDYNEGGTVYGTYKTVNRVQVKAGVTLRASGSRDNTFITGSGGSYSDDSSKNAYSNGAARCVYFLSVPTGADCGGGIVKGFTLRDGRTCPKYPNIENPTKYIEEQGGASTGDGLLVDCLLRDNGCGPSSRGGTMYKGTALRCHFESANRSCLAYSLTALIDSLISVSANYYLYSGCKAYNCTFKGNSYLRAGFAYNCFFIGTGTSNKNQNNGNDKTDHYNVLSRSEFETETCTAHDGCSFVTSEKTPYDTLTFRPLAGSVAIDGGDPEKYALATNGWKQAWLEECGKDYYGEERVVNGKIDVGCGEFQGMDRPYKLAISDEDNALVIDGADIGEELFDEDFDKELTFSRKFTSEKLLAGIDINGEFYSFGGVSNDYPVTVSLKWRFGFDYIIKAVYEENQKDWYVSPEGDDTNKGYHKNCPRKTLDKAMELAKENNGHIVHAAAGTYNESSEGYTGANRVVVKKGVGLVADEWPHEETVIEGALDTSDEAENGIGPNAMRCVYVHEGGYVRGFKLTNGRTKKGDNGGGAILLGGGLIDCEITGNGCSESGRGVYAISQGDIKSSHGMIIRCKIYGQVKGNYEIYNGTVVDSYAECSDNNYVYYGAGKILNCTMFGKSVRTNMKNLRIINSYLSKVSALATSDNTAFCTNCVFTSASDDAMVAKGHCFYDEATCLFSVKKADNREDNFRPKYSASPLVDAGSKALYDANFPSKWVQFKEGDLKGGQRIYNAQIDVGCGEYDWRGDFASMLGAKAAISEMGENVTVDSASNIVVPEGDTIALSMPPRSPGRTTKYELTYTPEGGEKTVVTEVSSEAFSYVLAGPCTVQSLTRSGSFAITIR